MNTSVLRDPREYVRVYLTTHNIQVNERGELRNSQGKNNMDLFDTMYLDYLTQVNASNASEKQKAAALRSLVTPVSEKVLQKALTELITNKKIEYRSKIIEQFTCVTEDTSLVEQYVKALTGSSNPDDIAVVAHWMWQVKTKMIIKTPSYHIMPILYGKQGGGKTVAMNKLISPINNFRLNISMDQMTDDRYFKSMSENFVIVFDEMQGADRADIDALKKQVTIEENDYRPLGTNDVFKVRQACSFIGATNRPVAEQIVDTTGMRRFWQLDCQDKLDWDTLSNLDYVAMWKGINENRVDGYILTQMTSIEAKQDSLVAKDQISSYMEARGIVADKEPTKEVSVQVLYNDYREWATNNGFKPMDNNWFGRRLCGKGIKKEVKIVNKKTTNVYHIPEEVVLSSEGWLTLTNELKRA